MNRDIIIDQIGIIEAMIIIDQYIWCMAGGFNAFFNINLDTGETNFIGEVPDEEFQKARLYSDIQRYNEKLILVPMAAKDIAIYNMQSHNFIKVKLSTFSNTNNLYKKDYKFCKCVIYESFAYLFNVSFPAVIKIDLDSYRLQYLDEWLKFFEGKILNREKVYFRNAFRKDNKVYLASCCSNIVIEFDIECERFFAYELEGKQQDFSDVAFRGNRIYVSSLSGNEILILDRNNWNEIAKFNIFEQEVPSIDMIECEEKIYYFPVNLYNILVWEDEKKGIIRYSLQETSRDNSVYKVILDKESFFFIHRKTFSLVKWERNTGETQKKTVFFDNKLKSMAIKKYIFMNNIISEGIVSTGNWISNIDKGMLGIDVDGKIKCGNDIWNRIKESEV